MDFSFTEEQELFRASIDEAAAKLIGETYKERALKDGVWDLSVLKTLREMGLLGFGVPEKWGGQGEDIYPDPIMVGIICETLGKYDTCAADFWYTNFSKVELLTKFGTEEQRAYWFPKLAAGEVYISACFTEPQGGTDMANAATTAVLDGDEFILNGTKAAVTGAPADAHLLLARVDPSVDPSGMSLFIVPTSAPGVSVSVYNDFGIKPMQRGDVFLNDVRISASARLDGGNGGFKNIMSHFDLGRPVIALFCMAAARGVLEKALEFAKQRELFGRQLCSYEAFSFGYAEHFAKLDSYRLLAYKALWMRANHMKNTKEAAMVKALGCEAAVNACWWGARFLGHLGYTTEHDAMLHMADVMGYAWGDGSWEVCKMITARELGGREMLPYKREKKA